MPLPTASVAAPIMRSQKPDGEPVCVTAEIIRVMPARCMMNARRAPFFSPNASSIGPSTSSEMAMPHKAAPPIRPT